MNEGYVGENPSLIVNGRQSKNSSTYYLNLLLEYTSDKDRLSFKSRVTLIMCEGNIES